MRRAAGPDRRPRAPAAFPKYRLRIADPSPPLPRRPPRQLIAGVARQRRQVEEILPHPGRGIAAFRGVDEQCREAGAVVRGPPSGTLPTPRPVLPFAWVPAS